MRIVGVATGESNLRHSLEKVGRKRGPGVTQSCTALRRIR
jgi:hypothetical protein